MKKADWNLWIRSKYTGRKRKDGIDMEETIFRQELQKRTTAIEDLLKQYLPAEEGYQKTVIEAMNYSLMAGGKRLRPMLLQETYRMLGGEDDIIEPFMAAIEMIHTYSLVHDDLPAMDNDEYRRGRKTTWSVYGDGMGVLAGDGLLNYAFETAFRASYGSGKPVIGILAEYDALTGLSQIAGSETRKELVADGNGHGCGHNLLGAGSMAAAFAIKKYLEEKGEGSGKVILYGCPGEEGAATKAFMARDGVFAECDAALTWHPGNVNQVTSGTCNTCIQTEYKFTGVASHAAGAPDKGRSALDAVELMNIGVQFLREHMPDSARIHYSITDAGGDSPNVVQPKAQVLYMVRSIWVKDALELQERVDRIALAASMMTDTKMEKKFIDGCSNTVPNKVLESLMWDNFNDLGVCHYTEEELKYAKALYDSVEMKSDKLPGDATEDSSDIYEYVDEKSKHGTTPMNEFLVPYLYYEKPRMGSTDVGDVSWCIPTAQINTSTFPAQAPGHSWQNVSCGRTSIAHKNMLLAGKVIAATAIDLMEKPDVLQAAKDEFNKKMKRYGGYTCPVPQGAVPVIPGEKM